MAADPVATLHLPAQAMIGEALNFSVDFQDGSATSAGYGPYLDLFLPATGADGAGAATDDGVTFTGATYLGASVTSTVLTFDGAGHATHPYAKDSAGSALVVSGTPGDQLVVLQLPFGSFTPGQPAASVDVSANLSNLADAGTPLTIQARGGFRYGNDALDNPATDPSIVGAAASSAIAPTVMSLKTTYLGPEDETATGPNFPRQYLVTVDVASGQTLTNLDVSDVLPPNAQFVAVNATTIRGTSTATTAVSTPSTAAPGGTITRRFASVTGTTAGNDATLLFTVYIPRLDASANPVLDPTTGGPAPSVEDAKAQGNWTPIDARDAATLAVSDATPTDHTLTDRSLATQKAVAVVKDTGAPGPSPGDTLEYTIHFQVSDFFAFRNLVLADLISDGQHVDPTFAPTLQVDGNPWTLAAGAFGTANYTVAQNYTGAVANAPVFVVGPGPNDGTSTVTFRVSDEMVARGQDGTLLGGLITPGGGPIQAAPGDGPTAGTIVFRTVIQDKFADHYPSGEDNVDHNDVLDDHVTITGDVLSDADLTPTGSTVTDTSAASVNIISGALTQSIYAINGSTSFSTPAKIAPGDTVTYRLQYTLPTSDEEQLALYDYLPLPIFDATSVTAFDDAGASGSAPVIPAAGHANFGPADTFRPLSGVVPGLSRSASANSLTFTYPNYKDNSNSSTLIDLLFTVRAGDQPFADGLFLTNQARVIEGSTNAGQDIQDQIVQVQLTEPVLNITKGVVASDNAAAVLSPGTAGPVSFSAPGSAGYRGSGVISSNGLLATPVRSNVSKIDAGDLVTFALVVENTGSGLHGAFDVRLNDAMPAGFVVPAGGLNLQVTDGSGAPLAYSLLGSGLFDPAGGIELADPSASSGALAAYAATGGHNIAVVTYDLRAASSVNAGQVTTNTVTLFNYAGDEGGPDFTASDLTASATATIATPTVAKALTATDQAFTTGSNLAIGEVATYTVTITVPEGVTPSAKLVDTLPAGLAIVSLDSLTASAALSTSISGGFTGVLAGATVGSGGGSATFDFGTLTNADTDNSTPEKITAVYRVVALNDATNTNNKSRANNAKFSYSGGSASNSATATIKVPLLQVVKSASTANADAGDTVTYTLVLSHAGGSGTDAFDVSLSDALPAGLAFVPGSVTNTAGLAPTTLGESGGTITATFDTFAQGSTSTITFQATVGGGVGAYQTVTNTANVTYTTLPGNATTPRSAYSSTSTERTGSTSDPGGAANNLLASGSANVTVTAPALSKVIVSTDQPTTTGNNVVIGERVQYRLTITVPEGTTPGAKLVDAMPAGLAIVSLDSITASSPVSTSIAGGFAAVLSNATVPADGSSVTFDFGTLSDSDRDNSTAETIVLTYTVVTLNTAGNHAGSTLTNSATFSATGGSSTTSAPALTVVEPALQVTKSPSSATGDAGGPAITFTIVLAHAAGSGADAFDVAFSDAIPAGFTYVAGSLANTGGIAPAGLSMAGSTINATYGTLPLGSTSTITFQATLNGTTTPGQAVTNTASVAYTSLPGNVTTPVIAGNPASTERTGSTSDPGGALNTYHASGSGTVTVNANTIAGSVYADSNNNSAKNGGEPGIASVTITLAGVDNLGNVVNRTAATNASGAYSFTLLRPGSYTVSETQPAGYLDGKDAIGTPFSGSTSTNDVFAGLAIPLGVNAAGSGYNFGELRPASVAGTAYRDANNDGAKQGGEPGITGVSVTLTGTDDLGNAVNTVVTTNASGAFTFGILRPGTYTLAETQPAAYLDGKDSAGTTGGTLTNDLVSNFALAENQAATGVLFGELDPASLAGWVYLDANNDGTKQAGEAGIGGVAVTLTGTDDLGGAVNVVVTTTNGAYAFSGLRPGTYAISEAQPAGYLDGKDTAGTPGGSAATNDVLSGIALTAGTSGAGNNFGELLPSSLAGSVFADASNDGVRQAGEAGIAGVSVTLTGTDDLGQSVNVSATTAADGSYSFTSLRPGTYAVTEAQPAGYLDGLDSAGSLGGTLSNDRVASIALGQDSVGTGYTFGELAPSSLSGVVFADASNDGTQQPGEPGIAGATITLTGTDDLGPVSRSLTTAADGSYSFFNLRPGTYSVAEAQPAGYLDGKDAAGTTGGTLGNDVVGGIALGVGVAGTGYTFGELAPASLGGSVYSDLHNDGARQGGEPGIAGATVNLTGTDDLGHSVSLGATTAADGSYSFNLLRPGTYAIAENQPASYLDGKDVAGSLGGSVSNDLVGSITVPVAATGASYNFGELAQAVLVGSAYFDLNDDGVRQGGEPGIAGATITLTGTDDLGQSVNVTASTMANGSFSFTNLRPGTYALAESQPAGFLDGLDAAGTQGGTLSNDLVSSINLAPGASGTPYTFGELAPATLAGLIFNDANDDGTQQPGEPGIGGVSVTLTGTDDLGQSVNLAATTEADGSYLFINLRPGTYTVTEAQPTGYLDGLDAAGPLGGTLSNDQVSGIAVAAGNHGNAYTFGELRPASLAGSVYADSNNDGAKQGGEPGIAGATVTLTGTDDLGQAVTLAAVTAADGSYVFTNLRPGTYALAESQPTGFLDGLDAVGTLGGTASNDAVTAIAIGAGASATGYDFGDLPPASLSGFVYVDLNMSGAREPGEPGILGATVTLTGTDDLGQSVNLAATTNAGGLYRFAGLRPGSYALAESQPAGYLDADETVGTQGGSIAADDTLSVLVLSPGLAGTDNNFGELLPSSLAGSVYLDANDDGIRQAGETGVVGASVTLTGTNDRGQSVSLTLTTAADGSFLFDNLRPGTYALAESQPTGLLDGLDAAGSLGGVASNDRFDTLIVGEGVAASAYTFGELAPASLSGSAFRDANDDGARQAGESGIAGVTITLTGTDDLGHAVNLTATTAADGSYSFGNLRPGTYSVAEAQPAGYLDGQDAAGPLGGSVGNDRIAAIALDAGADAMGNTFGELDPASLAGSVYSDLNNDGTPQPGEPGIAGATVTLTGTDDLGQSVSLVLTTAADGSFSFNNLRPGAYAVAEDQPDGYLDGLDAAGSLGGSLSNDQVWGIPVAAGDSGTGTTFGELAPASISGVVYFDANGDGTQQAGEPGIAGATVTLTGTDDNGQSVSLIFTTAADGSFLFNNLRPGTYAIAESQPAGYLDGLDDAGDTGGMATDDLVAGIALAAGQSAGGDSFGELVPASLAGSVFDDADDDGVRQPGEAGIAGVSITLAGTDDRGNTVSLTLTTAPDGSFSFTNLRPGTYALTEAQPDGYLDGTDAVGTQGGSAGDDQLAGLELVPGAAGSSNTFGEIAPSSLAGFVFLDANDDGAFNMAEPGLAGVTVTLTGTDDLGQAVSLCLTTAADGSFRFDNLRPGTYAAVESQPAVRLDGGDAAGTAAGIVADDLISSIVLAPGTLASGYTFGELDPASLAGTVFDDRDDDGIQVAGEPGIAGVAVSLTGTDDRGQLVNLTITTAADGSFRFDNLRPGTYAVAESQPAAFLDGDDSAGGTGGLVTDDLVGGIVLAPDAAGAGITFAELEPASLAGAVFIDANNDGIRQPGEAGISGATITVNGVDDCGSAVSLVQATAADGSYNFANLRPGTYALAEAQPAGFLDGDDATGTPGGTVADDLISGLVLAAGEAGAGNTFGELAPASLSGSAYMDANNDGTRQAGEAGIAGVTITLTGTDDLGNAVSLAATTGADGGFVFPGLRPGTYALTEAQPSAYLDGRDAAGTAGGSVGNDAVSGLTLAPGSDETGYTFGELASASLSGSVFLDAGNDGVRGDGEAGIAGVAITLTGTDDLGQAVALTTTTAADGTYSFANLRPGTYALAESQPAGYLDGKDAAGDLGGVASNDAIAAIDLPAGADGSADNFGELRSATLAGSVFLDVNDDGLRQANEAGIAGVSITLTGTDDLGQSVNLAATSAADGSYRFANLRPGTYTVTEGQPASYLDGTDTAGSLGGSAGNDRLGGIAVAAGVGGTGYTFGELRPARLAGSVFLDASNDGARQPGESGIGGVAVTLIGTDDRGGQVRIEATTAADGTFAFDGLRPGRYAIAEAQPASYGDGLDAAGSAGGSAGNDLVAPIDLRPGATGTDYTFGERGATLSGNVYLDTNAGGSRNVGEPGMGGVAVELHDATGRLVATTTTAPDGSYAFPNLAAGRYTVVELRPDRLGQTTPTAQVVQLTTRGLAGLEFGLATGTISGSVYSDLNNDGARQPGEPGLAGVAVTLTGTDTSGQPVSRTTTTAGDGTYRFDGLLAGAYSITECQPAGYLDGKDAAGDLGGIAEDDRVEGIALAPGAAGTGATFGELAPAALSGFAYLDLHRDNVMDPGDVGIAHVVMTLAGTDDLGTSVLRRDETADDGSYQFAGLRPGTYALTETQPSVFLNAATNVGSQGGQTSTNQLATLVLAPGVSGASNNFGEVPRPNCKLSVLLPFGVNSVDYLRWRRSINPARFDHYHPGIGPILGRNGTPNIPTHVPSGPVIRHWLPRLGQPATTRTAASLAARSAHQTRAAGRHPKGPSSAR